MTALAEKINVAMVNERNTMAWLLVWQEGRGEKARWNVEMIHPAVDLEYNPIRIENEKEYRMVAYAQQDDEHAVMVNLLIDFEIDPMRKVLDCEDIANAIRAARDNEVYWVRTMMQEISGPDGMVWHQGLQEIPEEGRNVLFHLENKNKNYMYRNDYYQPEANFKPWMFPEDKEEGFLDIEEEGSIIVKEWCYLPELPELPLDKKRYGVPIGFTETQKVIGEWCLTIKAANLNGKAECYYSMDMWTDENCWEYEKGNSRQKVLYWTLPGALDRKGCLAL